jgi:hypothetical protein
MPYKDSLFRSLFGNEKAALALYNALQGTDYREEDTDIVINTLDSAVFSMKKNDLSFLVNGRLVVLIEHQSSINKNMPLRFLHPVLRLFEGSIPDKRDFYRKPRLRLPRPQFIVLYNGTADYPEQETLRLSDAFEEVEGFEEILLELVVKVYNINEGRNAEMASRCEELRCYAYFVSRVQFHDAVEKKRDPLLDEKTITRIALRKAMQDCKDKNLLVDFWDNLSPEEVNMLGFEWDMNIALEVEREESYEKGRIEGREEGREDEREEIARNALAEGASVEFVQKITGLDLETIKNLQEDQNLDVT